MTRRQARSQGADRQEIFGLTITAHTIAVLDQGLDLVRALDDDAYTAQVSTGIGSIGAHLRHTIDFFRNFLRGLGEGRIDYDARDRDPRLETDREAAEAALLEVIEQLGRIDIADAGNAVTVHAEGVVWASPTDGWAASSIGRELQVLLSHTVHHYALIGLLMRYRGVEPPAGFGVAPSTSAHRAQAERDAEMAETAELNETVCAS